MKLHRIYAIILRNIFLLYRSYDRLVDTFYWITLDVLLWGLTGFYFQRFAPDAQNVIFMIISGVIFWNITYRVQADISISTLEELWNKNLVNIFVSPLKIKEFISALVILGIVKCTLTLLYGSLLAFVFFKINLFTYSFHLLPIFLLLILNGWWIGFLVSSVILFFGTKVQTFAWSFVWAISPFSAIYFPLSALPPWAQYMSKIFPTSYIFEQGRNLLYNRQIDYGQLAISFCLSIMYITISIIVLNLSFKSILNKGLVKVY